MTAPTHPTDVTLLDRDGAACLTLTLSPLDGACWALRQRWHEGAHGVPSREGLREGFERAMARAHSLGATSLATRVLRRAEAVDPSLAAVRADALGEVLGALGFVRAHDRVEFQLALDEALDGRLRVRAAGDPLRWRSLAPAGDVTLAHAAAMLSRVSVGDPMSSPDDDAEAFLRATLGDPDLAGDGACVQLGARDGEDVAFVMAQCHRAGGASRITYLGVVPEHRGRGLGAYVHLRGLAMLRAQHAARYHGGTTSTNLPMLRLFEALGAAPSCTLEEWSRVGSRPPP